MLPNNFYEGAAQASAAIYGLKGGVLSEDERCFFQEVNPLGFILFARNCEDPVQVKVLTDDLRSLLGRNCPILIDQEGGRVQRLKSPQWRDYPPARQFGERYEAGETDAALEDLRYCILQLAEELIGVGVNVDCAPVLDVLCEATHDVIGDRAFSADPEIVGRLGLSVCRNLLVAGVTPVIKHIPGHGRGRCDSHKELPCVSCDIGDLEKDFDPFRFVSKSVVGSCVWAMTAHIVYDAVDAEHPASCSAKVIGDVIRGSIGFEGFLISDDLDMQALERYGDVGARANACLLAGCDAVLHCSGDLALMEKIAKVVPNLDMKALKRLQNGAEAANIAA
ncbi:MAG: beta-N-acetylhexosaminidase [Alphaproteobacteria bacterium]|nr:beta-N-acetylhexosaminidase [Alphaproteobacteria bacterium]